jgi:solute:Na+ symporter, SSS family
MYPHSITGILSSNSRLAIKRNAALLPAYSFLLGLLGLLLQMFPSWFVGFAFGAIAIGALVPASIMSIAAANLFTRNVYREYFRPNCTPQEESNTAKLVSLIVKAGALFFIIFLPLQYAINLQLLGGVWIIQTLPAIVLGLYTRWFHRSALVLGWAVGMIVGTVMAATQGFTPVFPVSVAGVTLPGYSALWSVLLNFGVAIVGTWIFSALGVSAGRDETRTADYTAVTAPGESPDLDESLAAA